MKFEVRYPSGATHEVELPGNLAVVGRDPSCDLVLNNGKCSRRHAVIESGPDGLLLRDSGSANGVYLNGKRVQRSALVEGDEIRFGEVIVKVLAGEAQGTLVMGPDELPEEPDRAPSPPAPRSGDIPTVPPRFLVEPTAPPPRPAAPAAPASALPRMPPPPAAPSARAPAAPPRVQPRQQIVSPARNAAARASSAEPLPRPLTGMVLAALWLLSALAYVLAAGIAVWLTRGTQSSAVVPVIACFVMAAVSAVMGVGLWLRGSWARVLQIATAGVGLLTCVFTPLSVAALAYMLRGTTRIHYSGRESYGELTDEESGLIRADSGEGIFMAGVLIAALLSLVLVGISAFLGLPALTKH